MGAIQQVLASYGASFVGPLDDYTAGLAGVWSVRRRLLASWTGSLIRIRRSSDDAELDIGFDADGNLDTAAISAFVGANSAYVTLIYDQSGLGRDLVMATASAQRRIVNAGTLETVGMTATSDNSQGYRTATFSTYDGTTAAVFVRGLAATSAIDTSRVLSLAKNGTNDYFVPSVVAMSANAAAGTILGVTYGTGSPGVLASAAVTLDAQFVGASLFNGSTHVMKQSGSSNSVAFTASLSINEIYAAGTFSAGNYTAAAGDQWAESAVYFADKTADEAAIRAALTPA